jgi:transglutaminase-like putative cysteine protease
LYAQNYREITVVNNSVFEWNISGDSDTSYTLGVSSSVQSETLLVADLNGAQALTTTQIRQQHADLVDQYCQNQSVDGVAYIDPFTDEINDRAHEIRREENTDNAFLLAKALFVWLKENYNYYVHPSSPNVQPALETFRKKTGDCDDLSFLYISVCRALNIPARFIRGYLITTAEDMPSIGPHAWAEVFVGGNLGNQGWIPVECACKAECTSNIHQNFGVEDVAHLRLFVDDGSSTAIEHSLSSVSWSYVPGMEITAESFVHIDQYMILKQQQLVVTKDGIRSYQDP